MFKMNLSTYHGGRLAPPTIYIKNHAYYVCMHSKVNYEIYDIIFKLLLYLLAMKLYFKNCGVLCTPNEQHTIGVISHQPLKVTLFGVIGRSTP